MTEAEGAGEAQPGTFSLLAASGSFGMALRLLAERLSALTSSVPADPRQVATEAAALLAAGRRLRSQADARPATVTGQDAALFARVAMLAFQTARAVGAAHWTGDADRTKLAFRAFRARRRLDEFVVHLADLRQRLDDTRRLQAGNALLEQLVAVQSEIDRQWALPGAGLGAEVGDGLTALEVELRARQAVLAEQLGGGVGEPEDVLGRAVEALEALEAAGADASRVEQTTAR